MRRLFILTFLFLLAAPDLFAGDTESGKSDYVKVYYFHGSFRCSNCYNIEAYTKEALEQSFKKELDSNELVFEPVNVDEKENRHFVNDYDLYTKSVVLSSVRDNKQTKYKNLEKVWGYLGDKEAFLGYVKEEVEKFITDKES